MNIPDKSIIVTKDQKKPRILIVGPGLNQVGGVATFIDILLSSTILNENYDLIRLDTTRAQEDLGLGNRFSLTNLTYLSRQMYQFVGIAIRMQPRLVHLLVTSGLAFWKAAAFILLSQFFGLKTVAHLQGGMFDQYYRKSKPFQRRFIGWVFHRADVVIVLSGGWRHFLLEEVRQDIRVEIVSNTVDRAFAKALDQVNDSTFHKENIILFLGSLGQRKGVYDILRAVPLVCNKHPEVRFLFAGGEEFKGEKKLIDQVCKENHLTENVQFLGQITGPAKLELFQRAMIFLLPTYGENLPFALLEAMSVGLPVITTPVGAIPEVVKDGYNGFLIQPGDYQDLAARIDQLLNDPDLRSTFSKAAIARIRQDYLPDVAMASINNIYSQLLSGSKKDY